ncbi:oxidoreductase [Streptomyces kasugaensis]|uniref:Oxidoreductase n=1 Tax=Streptomyces kasugaensis TaxID=1946 RepID=A0A4Q9HXR2_STRKA|nr:VOC family protein [Streptomyces kasugaensis]TBO59795.1 oxidoreductase [Streptomyces kasugaensis]WSK10344.1 VOC family protein [Streptomyces celluloflavus]WSK17222.1 VOC family protein [Streptomyces celluloflavus]
MITHVRSVALGVPDIGAAREFFEKHWQLDLVGTDSDRVFLGAGCQDGHVLRLRATDEPRVDLLCLAAATDADVDEIAERVAAHPLGRLLSTPATSTDAGGGYRFRFLDCEGRTVEVSSGVAARAFRAVEPGESRPTGISHVVLNSADLPAALAFYQSVFGLKVSDWVEDIMVFLRAGTAHHLLAFTRAPHVSLNHVAFELRGIDEFMRATGDMVRKGYAPLWGPGRHGVGANTFTYFQEPTSSFVAEYTTGMLRIDPDHEWTPRVYPGNAQTSDTWGVASPRDDAVSAQLRGCPDTGLWQPPPV